MASTLHRIILERFKMDINFELTCKLGMSILCRVESGWGQEGDPVAFYFRGQRLAGPEVHIGDNIYMNHMGSETTWVVAKKPRDPRLSLLWEFGYRSSTRIRVDDRSPKDVVHALRVQAGFEYPDEPDDWGWREPLPCGSKKPNIIKDQNGKVLVALYSGRTIGRDTTYCQWYLAEEATTDDVKAALIAHRASNANHPLLQ